jgi:hypothetical protein
VSACYAGCVCGRCVDHAAYLRGRREARRKLGYSDLDDTPDVATEFLPSGPIFSRSLGMPDRVIPATPATAAPSAFPAERQCKGCKVGEFSPIGAGPFEDGLCRYCAQLNTHEPIVAAVKRSVPAPAGRLQDETVADALRYVIHGAHLGTRVRIAAMVGLPVWGIALYILIMMVMAAQR